MLCLVHSVTNQAAKPKQMVCRNMGGSHHCGAPQGGGLCHTCNVLDYDFCDAALLRVGWNLRSATRSSSQVRSDDPEASLCQCRDLTKHMVQAKKSRRKQLDIEPAEDDRQVRPVGSVRLALGEASVVYLPLP